MASYKKHAYKIYMYLKNYLTTKRRRNQWDSKCLTAQRNSWIREETSGFPDMRKQ